MTVDDAMFAMPAVTVRIPAGWKFQGTVIDNAPCDASPSVVFCAHSADGSARATPE